ncbi:MAG: transglycosylase SLT domain-containing protein [Saprospiraceae bacterium]
MDRIGHRWGAIMLPVFLLIVFQGFASSPVTFEETEVARRVELMNSEVVQPRYDVVVRSYLRTYLVNHRAKAQKILGRSVLYFPVFEDFLRRNNLPLDLKYLPIVESALEPKATSRVGAAGLWQFMPSTGRMYGLQVDDVVDERRDPLKSTEAAVVHLQDLFEKFENWELAIAAYNSGSGRVSRAVKRARSTSYWKIRGYLPRETANYVPAFIAAAYLVRYFEEHGLEQDYPSLDLQLTETISIYHEVTFDEIAEATGTPKEIIATLNPGFPKEMVPASAKGYYFTLPQRAMREFRILLESKKPDQAMAAVGASSPLSIKIPKEAINHSYITFFVEVAEGQTLESIAGQWHSSVYQLRAWNGLKSSQEVSVGQKLKIYQLKESLPPPSVKFELVEPLDPLPLDRAEFVEPAVSGTSEEDPLERLKKRSYCYYLVTRPERLLNISLRFKVDPKRLQELNGIYNYKNLKSGTLVKIAEMY